MRTETDKEAILGMISELYQRLVNSNNIARATLKESHYYEDMCSSMVYPIDPATGQPIIPAGDAIIGDYGRTITLTVRMK